MSAFDGEQAHREIIIVRRGGNDDDDGHHGGVWKIAFADFMTAMMCFFLVMWLVNAASEQTKAAIASYFNPMTLVEPQPTGTGVDDPGEAPQTMQDLEERVEKTAAEEAKSTHALAGPGNFVNSQSAASETEETSDEHLFADPYAVLAEIAAETGNLQNISRKGDGGAQTSGPATGAEGGESYRDPFAPDFWSQEVADDDEELDVFREPQDMAVAAPIAPEAETAEAEPVEESLLPEETDAQGDSPIPAEPVETAAGGEEPSPAAQAEPEAEALAQQLRTELADAFGADEELNQTLSVTVEEGGVLISVTDELDYGMFQVGSAVPQRELVLAMEKIGETLRSQPGRITINGHTDGRPFAGGDYDNWRLSTARAHAAYYMLVRGGLPEERIGEIAGYADRKLKVPDDPLADANRRIEILLEIDG